MFANNDNFNNNQFLHHTQMMGLVNAFKTGEPTVDILLAVLIPYIISRLLTDLKAYLQKLIESLRQSKAQSELYERSIVSCSTDGNQCNGTFFDNSYNAYIVKAIILYVNKNCHLEMRKAELYLTALDRNKVVQRQQCDRRGNTTATVLEMSEISETPVTGEWHEVGTFGADVGNKHAVSMKFGHSKAKNEDEEGSKGRSSNSSGTRLEINLRSTSKESIRAFVETCQDWYLEQIRKSDTNSRYMFDIKAVAPSGNPQHQAYKLGDDKTFDTLFSRPSRELLRIVDQFQTKEGKYAIRGYPHKLGLLLSGPPGTGKTSLIKALSQYTGRHLVTIPLNRISTNAALMNVFHCRQVMTNGTPHALNFEDLIYVFEDVDACTDIVFKRPTVLDEQSGQQKLRSEEDPAKRAAILQKMEDARVKKAARATSKAILADRLNLSGLLNVLDGVVETPGRILIMTTNRPAMLDPALIRPGRTDRHLHLGEMELDDVCAMLTHYYPNDSDRDGDGVRRRLGMLLERQGVTPAQVEHLVAEAETVEDFLHMLDIREVNKGTTDNDSEQPRDYESSTASSSASSFEEEEEEAEPSAQYEDDRGRTL